MRAGIGVILAILLLGFCLTYPHESSFKTQEKVVALTFDDGPNPPFTDALLRVLARHQTKATFFLIGRHIERFPQTVQILIEAGHQIGNHTYSHPKTRFANPWTIKSEIEKTDSLLSNFGIQDPAFRAPYGGRSLFLSLALLFAKKKNTLFNVSSTLPDYRRPDPKEIFDSVARQIQPGAVIDLHDGEGVSSETITAVDALIPFLRAQGYEFLTIDELRARANRS